MKVPDLFVGRRLFVGCGNPVGLGVGPTEIRGSSYIEGPLMVGNFATFPIPEANLMVARCINPEALPIPLSIFKVSSRGLPPTPIDVMFGDPTGPVGISADTTTINIINTSTITVISPTTFWEGIKNLIGAETITGAKAQTGAEARSGAKCVNGSQKFNGAVEVEGIIRTNVIEADYGVFKSVAAPFKQFDISHPTKSGMRLRHVCVEGPEIGVYYRGRLNNESVINLPEYWRGLVDAESITVQLTPHGCYQELYVKEIQWGTKIVIVNNSGGPIDCSYVVFGKRKDVPDLEVEYVGTEMKGGK